MAAPTEQEQLRKLLGEEVPDGGDPSDTLFSETEIQLLLDQNPDNLERAAYEGWRIKAAEFANMVDVTDGNASRAMSDLMSNADKMVKLYQRASTGPTEGRTRIGRIRRSS
jgi:hypothetical protein